MPNTVLVLGGGVGGLVAASRVRELLPEHDRVLLVDRAFDGALGLSMLWVLRGWRNREQVRVRPTPTALRGIDMIKAEIETIDVDRRQITTEAGELAWDALVIALGAAIDAQGVPGLDDAFASGTAGEFYTLAGAEALHHRLRGIDSGRLAILVAGVPFKCPAAPFEGALLAADLLRSRGVRDSVRIDAFTPDPLPMPVAGPDVGTALVQMLEEHDIGFHPNKKIERVENGALHFTDHDREPFDLLAVVPPHRPPAPLTTTGLGTAGWIPVDAATLATDAEGVWAIGDVTALTLPSGKPLPKAAVFAEGEAETVATGVARYLGYDVPEARFAGYGGCYIEIGGRQAAKGDGDFFAEPAPAVTLYDPSTKFHDEKVAQEADWLNRWNK